MGLTVTLEEVDADCDSDILRVFLGGISVSSFLLFLLVSLLFSLLPPLVLLPVPPLVPAEPMGIRMEVVEGAGAAAAL